MSARSGRSLHNPVATLALAGASVALDVLGRRVGPSFPPRAAATLRSTWHGRKGRLAYSLGFVQFPPVPGKWAWAFLSDCTDKAIGTQGV